MDWFSLGQISFSVNLNTDFKLVVSFPKGKSLMLNNNFSRILVNIRSCPISSSTSLGWSGVFCSFFFFLVGNTVAFLSRKCSCYQINLRDCKNCSLSINSSFKLKWQVVKLFSIVKLKFRIENKKDCNIVFFVLVSPFFSKARNFRVHKVLA